MSSTTPSSLAAADLFQVNGLVVAITGGATGIGLMMAKALEENGAKVYIIGRRREVLEKTVKEHAKHGNLVPIAGDVTSKTDLQRIVDQITKEVGYINLLIANAGISGPSLNGPNGIRIWGPDPSSLEDVQKHLWNSDQDSFNQAMAVNVGGVYYSIVAFLPLLDAGNKKGNVVQSSQVITTSSIAGFTRVPAAHYAYSASKAAVTHMMKQFATTFAKYMIRFNVIAPGLYPSEMTEAGIAKLGGMSDEDKASKVSPLLRTGNAEDMAGIILWLASKAGAWIDGNVVITDGGKCSVVPSTY